MKTKKIIFITGTIIGLILLMMVFFVYIVISSKKLNNGYNYNQLKENNTNDEMVTQTFKVSPNNLYVDKYNERFSNYSKLNEVTYAYESARYYINNNKLYKDDGTVSEVNINGETPKYLTMGYSGCSGSGIMVLTEEGNIYGSIYYKEWKQLYDGGKASEIFFIDNYAHEGATCSYYLAFALIDNELYQYVVNGEGEIIKFEKQNHEVNMFGNYILFADSALYRSYYNKLNNSVTIDKNEFLSDDDGNKILVSFIFEKDDLYYIIDTNGNMYTFSSQYSNDKVELTKINTNIGKINHIEVVSNNELDEDKFKYHIKKIVFYDSDGNKITYSEENNFKLYYAENSYLYDKTYNFNNVTITLKGKIISIRDKNDNKLTNDIIKVFSTEDIHHIGYHQYMSNSSNKLEEDKNIIDISINCNESSCDSAFTLYQYNISENKLTIYNNTEN